MHRLLLLGTKDSGEWVLEKSGFHEFIADAAEDLWGQFMRRTGQICGELYAVDISRIGYRGLTR